MEKLFVISITDKDGLSGESKCRAANKTAALKEARQYIKAWGLGPATINYCEEVPEEESEKNGGGENL